MIFTHISVSYIVYNLLLLFQVPCLTYPLDTLIPSDFLYQICYAAILCALH